ncbi:MAG TPA: GNAT family N-acetyltransferase [Cytophagaceae bacterium]|jgi:ribosomal protein S18 acetylase RimI-like enzyme|nr:GNAT family N-acetyltransferase [Cytophagaceae bacterium]
MNTIRKATIDDLQSLAILFDGYRAFYEMKSDLKAATTFLEQRIINKESEIFVAVKEDGTLTGFIQLYPLFSSTQMKRLWLLNDLFVDLAYRGQGISKLLLQQGQAFCEQTGGFALLLETAKTNVIGNQLYPAAGFVLDKEHNYYTWNPKTQ